MFSWMVEITVSVCDRIGHNACKVGLSTTADALSIIRSGGLLLAILLIVLLWLVVTFIYVAWLNTEPAILGNTNGQ